MSSSTTPRSEPTERPPQDIPRRWTSAFRSPPSSILPRRGSGEWTPILVSLALLAGLIAQFALPNGSELPEPSGLAPRRMRMPIAPTIPDYPAVLRAPIFAPDRAPGEAPATAVATGDATGVQVLGLASTGRSASAVVRASDGSTHVLQPGQELQGWRLVSVAQGAAVFSSPRGQVSVPLGGPAPGAAGAHPGQATQSEPHS